MREKYESLSLATLKELAKARGLKGVSALRKPELVQRMLEEDEKESSLQNENTPKGREEAKQESRPETKPEVRSDMEFLIRIFYHILQGLSTTVCAGCCLLFCGLLFAVFWGNYLQIISQ